VCRAWHVTCGVQVPTPGEGEAEGKRKGNCVAVRRGGGGSPTRKHGAMNKNRIHGVVHSGRAGIRLRRWLRRDRL